MNLFDRPILDAVKILETRDVLHEFYQVCATANAILDEQTHELVVTLNSFVRRFEMRGEDRILHPPWLPKKDVVRTHVTPEEAPDAAKEIFQRWSEKLHQRIPPPVEWDRHPPWLGEGAVSPMCGGVAV